jgi:hypothetical protein
MSTSLEAENRRRKNMSQTQYINYTAIKLLEEAGHSAPSQQMIDQVERKLITLIQTFKNTRV